MARSQLDGGCTRLLLSQRRQWCVHQPRIVERLSVATKRQAAHQRTARKPRISRSRSCTRTVAVARCCCRRRVGCTRCLSVVVHLCVRLVVRIEERLAVAQQEHFRQQKRARGRRVRLLLAGRGRGSVGRALAARCSSFLRAPFAGRHDDREACEMSALAALVCLFVCFSIFFSLRFLFLRLSHSSHSLIDRTPTDTNTAGS